MNAVQQLGYSTDIITGVDFTPSRTDSTRNRLMFHDESERFESRLSAKKTVRSFNTLLSSPFGSHAADMSTAIPGNFVLPEQRNISAALDSFDRRYASYRLFDAAYHHAITWRRPLQVRLPRDAPRPNIVHLTHATPLRISGSPTVVTLHDIIPIILPHATLEHLQHYRIVVQTIIDKADHIITVSERSRADIIRLFRMDEKRISNLYQSVTLPDTFISKPEAEIEHELDFLQLKPNGYFLYFGAIEPKKNIKRLIEAYRWANPKRPLIICGTLGWDYEADLEAINDKRYTKFIINDNRIEKLNSVRHIPYVPLEQLVGLIRGARAVLFPSLYEGFGLPAAEAMLLGKPVLASNSSSLPEIAGDAAMLVDPMDVAQIARAIRILDSDSDICAELSRRGPQQMSNFSPQIFQQKLREIYANFQ
ncbi:glycosyltransferase family 1 protein [Beijerinckia sp. 28-YEA-48]|uniref:glycosyltransferase family 4 protein n=1 Tax=unclassified Beijerinckia TaxID=2638183 RepID=UPI00147C2861